MEVSLDRDTLECIEYPCAARLQAYKEHGCDDCDFEGPGRLEGAAVEEEEGHFDEEL